MIVPAPASVRQAGAVVALEGAVLAVVAVVLLVRHLGGVEDPPWLSAYGTALFFVGMGAAVLAAGWALWNGRRWGRGLAVFVQLLLLPIAWWVAVDSDRMAFGVPLAIVALAVLVLLFTPSAVQWAAAAQASGPADSANVDSSGPDTR